MEVYYCVILIADISLMIAVDSGTQEVPTEPRAPVHAHPCRKIFASYSHKDLGIVRKFEVYARAFGDGGKWGRPIEDFESSQHSRGRSRNPL